MIHSHPRRRQLYLQKLMLIPPDSFWNDLQCAKQETIQWFLDNISSSVCPTMTRRGINVTGVGAQIGRCIDSRIIQFMIFVLEYHRADRKYLDSLTITGWLRDTAPNALHNAVRYASNDHHSALSPRSETSLNPYPRLFIALKIHDVALLSSVLKRAMIWQHNKWLAGDESARLGPKAWRMHSLAISAILEDSPRAVGHLEWGDLLAKTAWRWCLEGVEHNRWFRITQVRVYNANPLLFDPVFLTDDRLRRIRSVLPWLISDDLIDALQMSSKELYHKWSVTKRRSRESHRRRIPL